MNRSSVRCLDVGKFTQNLVDPFFFFTNTTENDQGFCEFSITHCFVILINFLLIFAFPLRDVVVDAVVHE